MSSVRLAAFRHRPYRLFWLSQVATNVGSWMMAVATGWLVLQITNSPAFLGYNAAIQAAPILFFSLIGGVVADRFDRLKLSRWAQVVQIVPDAILAWLVTSGNIRVEHVFAYSFLTATINGLSTPARQALTPSLVPRDSLLSAVALNSILWQGSAVLGPALAGLILGSWGLSGSFNLNVVSDLVSLALLAFVRAAPHRIEIRSGAGWRGIRDGAVYAWHHPYVRPMLVGVGLVTLLGRPYAQIMPVFARDVFHVGAEGLGVMMTVPAAGTIVVGVLMALLPKIPLVRFFFATWASYGLALLVFSFTRNFPLALVMLFIVGASTTATAAATNTLLQQIAEERMRGRVMSLYMASTWGTWRVGSLPLGLLATAWGAPLSMALFAAILLAALLPNVRNRALLALDGPQPAPPALVATERRVTV